MKSFLFCIVTFLSISCLQAQVIEGVVYEARTGETIPGAYIYLDGTSIITTSDAAGRFKLVVNQKINTSLVFKHLSYETLVIEKPFERLETSFFLTEKASILSGAVVVAASKKERYTRTEKMALFKRVFLGEGDAGKSCVILNEDDLLLNYDDDADILTASSSNPIIIENRRLAYRITYDLHRFSVQFTKTIHSPLMTTTRTTFLFKGTSFFEDLSPYNTAITRRRDETYQRSRENFWKNFVAGTLDEAKFRIYNRSRQIKVEEYFTVVDAPPHKVVLVNPGTNISRFHEGVQEGVVYGVIGIMYNNRYSSEVVFRTNRFSVDEFGSTHTSDDLVFIGDMCHQRIGDMLPLDYVCRPPQVLRRR